MAGFSKPLLVIAAASLLSACAYGPPPGYYGPPPPPGVAYQNFDDPCFYDADSCGYAYYDGPIWWDGTWYRGRHPWRDWGGGPEFFIGGDWHHEVRIGPGGYWHGPDRWHRY